jgi:hypothetical protein
MASRAEYLVWVRFFRVVNMGAYLTYPLLHENPPTLEIEVSSTPASFSLLPLARSALAGQLNVKTESGLDARIAVTSVPGKPAEAIPATICFTESIFVQRGQGPRENGRLAFSLTRGITAREAIRTGSPRDSRREAGAAE